ncbi:hypothetical protein F5Y11DRAFT_356919 [Daldinia sp. FL1419]|nr:hypothetical protein F5Y11DRAFT_356919 [Daldinia sp. FL1419]
MQQRFPDGLPVNCLPSCNQVTNQRRNCATQSTANSADLPSVDTYYIPSPTPQVAEGGHQAQSQPSSSAVFPMTVNTSIPTYQNPQIHSASSSPQGVWPTPPSTTCEEDLDNYSYKDSPTSGSRGSQPLVPCSGRSSVVSPRSWSPQTAQHINIHQPFLKESDHIGIPQSEVAPISHSHSEPNSSVIIQSGSPQGEHGLEASYSSYGQDDSSQHPGQGLEENEQESEKADGPYAQLIHQAFMSRRTRAMTLQEIYQWFRENTDKEKTDKGNKRNGWQNSIRHNLSMNHAFVRRERKASSDDPLSGSGEAKKISQWVLEEWAVNGVQSTTRYRSKGNSSRRAKSRNPSRTNAHASARAMSGRKGGKKAAASKRAIMGRQNPNSMFTPGGGNNNLPGQVQSVVYEGLAYPLPSHTRDEPMTPPDPSHEGIILAPNSMQPMILSANAASHEFPFASNVSHYGQHSHHNMYSIENVTGIFQGHQASINVQGGQGLPTTMHSDFNNSLFEDPEDSRNHRLSFPYWNQPGAGGQFQQ